MKKWAFSLFVIVVSAAAHASWYWPFSSERDDKAPPRLSELMEQASLLIDEAADLAADGKTEEAVAKYRATLVELDRVELANADRAATPEFNSLKNKRAYVEAAIDSLLLAQARDNARPVAVSDTSELQKKYDAQRAARAAAKDREAEARLKPEARDAAASEPADGKSPAPKIEAKSEPAPEAKTEKKAVPKKGPMTRAEKLATASADLARQDFAAVDLMAKELLSEKPNDAAALNLKAAAEVGKGDFKAAEETLDQAILSNPRSPYAYCNMARLYLKSKGDRSGAKRYYETALRIGGARDAKLEALLK